MNKKDIPLSDKIENNPDAEYIRGMYSTFDVELSRKSKDLAKKYNELKDFGKDEEDEFIRQVKADFSKNMKLEYKKSAQMLAAKKMTENKEALIKYGRDLRQNIMNAILNNEILLEYALHFKDLSYSFEKEHFITILDRVLSDNIYHMGRSHVSFCRDEDHSGWSYSSEGVDDNKRTTITFYSDVDTLDEFICVFAHEYSHKITSENPNLGPLGAQAAHIANKFYISPKENMGAYRYYNADELLSYTIEQFVSQNFEKDLRLAVAQREKMREFAR